MQHNTIKYLSYSSLYGSLNELCKNTFKILHFHKMHIFLTKMELTQ